MALLRHCTDGNYFSFSLAPLRRVTLRVLVVENVSLWCKRLSKKSRKKHKNTIKTSQQKKKTQKATSHAKLSPIIFPAQTPPTPPTPITVSLHFHLHQQKVHSFKSFWNIFFPFSVFVFSPCTQKITKSSKKHHWIGLRQPAAGHLHKTLYLIYLF